MSSTGFSTFNVIAIIGQLSRTILERRLPDGLKVAHFSVLNHLARRGDGKTPLELATAFQVTKGAMTKTLNRLQERGCIELAEHPLDGRSKLVFLTELGAEMRDNAILAVQPFIEELHTTIPEHEFEAALPFLQKLAKLLDEKRE